MPDSAEEKAAKAAAEALKGANVAKDAAVASRKKAATAFEAANRRLDDVKNQTHRKPAEERAKDARAASDEAESAAKDADASRDTAVKKAAEAREKAGGLPDDHADKEKIIAGADRAENDAEVAASAARRDANSAAVAAERAEKLAELMPE